MDARRDNIGTRPSFAFMEICLGLNIPHIVMEHPTLVTLERCATDLVLLGNVRISERRLYLVHSSVLQGYSVVQVGNLGGSGRL